MLSENEYKDYVAKEAEAIITSLNNLYETIMNGILVPNVEYSLIIQDHYKVSDVIDGDIYCPCKFIESFDATQIYYKHLMSIFKAMDNSDNDCSYIKAEEFFADHTELNERLKDIMKLLTDENGNAASTMNIDDVNGSASGNSDPIKNAMKMIIKAIDPNVYIAMYLYMKYYKIFDLDLFLSFYDIIFEDEDYRFTTDKFLYCMNSHGYTIPLCIQVIQKCNPIMIGVKNHFVNDNTLIERLHDNVFGELNKNAEKYNSLKEFITDIKVFKQEVTDWMFNNVSYNSKLNKATTNQRILDQCECMINAIKKVCLIHISAGEMKKKFLKTEFTHNQVATESGKISKVLGFFNSTTPLRSCLYSTMDDFIYVIKKNIEDKIMKTRGNADDKIIANSDEKEMIVAEAFCIMVVQFATDPDNRNCLDLDALINNSLNKVTNEVQVISLLKSYYHDKNNANSDKRYIDLIGDIFDKHNR